MCKEGVMMQWETSIVIHRPVEAVFAFVIDPDGGSEWHRANEITPISEGPIGIGSTFRVRGKFLFWEFDSVSEVTEYEENRKVTYRSDTGYYPFELRYLFEPVESGTRLTEVGMAAPRGLMKLAIRMFVGTARSNSEKGLRMLKDILEAENM